MKMNPVKSSVAGFLTIAVEILVGIFLLMDPGKFMKTIIIVVGVGLLIFGAIMLIRFFVGQKKGTVGFGALIGAIIALIFGLVCIFASNGVIVLISVFVWVCGIFLIIAGIVKIASFFRVKNVGYQTGGMVLLLISGIIMTVFGVILLFHPFGSMEFLLQIGGIVLIVEAVIDLITLIITMKNAPRQVN